MLGSGGDDRRSEEMYHQNTVPLATLSYPEAVPTAGGGDPSEMLFGSLNYSTDTLVAELQMARIPSFYHTITEPNGS